MLPSRCGILAKAISKKHHPHYCHHHHSHRLYSHLTKQITCPHEHQHQYPTQIQHIILSHTSSITISLSLFISSHTHLPPDIAGTPTIGTLGVAPNAQAIAQRSYNHLAILKHHHNNNERNYNNIQNMQHLFRYSKKINNNNTVSTTHINTKNVLLIFLDSTKLKTV